VWDRRLRLVIAVVVVVVLIVLCAHVLIGKPVIVITYTPPKVRPTIITMMSASTEKITAITITTTMPRDEVLEYLKMNLKIKVDKESYKIGELVKITIVNNGDKSVELKNPPWTIFKYVNGKWVKVYTPICKRRTTTIYDIKRKMTVKIMVPETVIIGPHSSASWTWNMTIYGHLVDPGKYAITLRDDLVVRVGEKKLALMRIGGLTRDNLEPPVTYFTIEQ